MGKSHERVDYTESDAGALAFVLFFWEHEVNLLRKDGRSDGIEV